MLLVLTEAACFVAAGTMFNHVQVVTTKAKVVPTFKALIALKQALGFQTSKKDINLQPCDGDLQTVMQHMIVQMLHERGWHALQPTMLLSAPLPNLM